MILGENISWQYPKTKKPILKEVSFALHEGRIATFIGQSGAGKTTLLKCIAGLHCEYDGSMICKGEDLRGFSPIKRASTVGCVLQQFHLFPHFTVLKNCTYALEKVMSLDTQEAATRAFHMLEALGVAFLAESLPSQLSGGQQQRVAIARALVLRPQVLLLDEPTSALDPDNKASLETLLLDLNAKGLTIAISSHDMPFIRKVIDCIYFLEQGQIVEYWDKNIEALELKQKIKKFLSDSR